MTSTSDNNPDLTHDGFLGGKIRCWQPARGFRAGVDSVLLAASVPAKPGQTILELGCGPGVASCCLGARVGGVRQWGLELQGTYADLARRNGAENGVALIVHAGDVVQMPAALKEMRFDHVMMNPPFFSESDGSAAKQVDRETAHRGGAMEAWVDAAARRIAPKGYLSMIQRIERLPETLTALQGRLGSVDIWPLAGRSGRPAARFLLRARKEGRRPFRLLSPLILHSGTDHGSDQPDYVSQIDQILTLGASLEWPSAGN